jgi:hypothetical protein
MGRDVGLQASDLGLQEALKALVIPNAAFFIAAEEPVLSEVEGISVFSAAERQPFLELQKIYPNFLSQFEVELEPIAPALWVTWVIWILV